MAHNEHSYFFDSVAGDRKYIAAEYAAFFKSFLRNGVTAQDHLKLTAGSDWEVKISAGTAVVEGYSYALKDPSSVPISVSSYTLPRYDRIVLRLNRNILVRTINLQLIQGTPSATPTIPDLGVSNDQFDFPLGRIYVPAGAINIGACTIYDDRELVSTLDHKIESPQFTGTPTAPTPAAGTKTTQVATTAFVADSVSKMVTTDGNQTISGPKTFSGALSIITPTLATHAARKDYVDTAITTAIAADKSHLRIVTLYGGVNFNDLELNTISSGDFSNALNLNQPLQGVVKTGNSFWVVETTGIDNRRKQIATQCYIGQAIPNRSMYVRVKHDNNWSPWACISENTVSKGVTTLLNLASGSVEVIQKADLVIVQVKNIVIKTTSGTNQIIATGLPPCRFPTEYARCAINATGSGSGSGIAYITGGEDTLRVVATVTMALSGQFSYYTD